MTENQGRLLSPALVQRHLHGIDYPVTRDGLIEYARNLCESGNYPEGECDRVVQILSQLPDRQYQAPTDVSKAFGEMARKYLENASYPARRDDLVVSAREQGADEVVLDTIVLIPDEEYSDVEAVIIQIQTGRLVFLRATLLKEPVVRFSALRAVAGH
jgi:Protein of unknown function (DUF2795)